MINTAAAAATTKTIVVVASRRRVHDPRRLNYVALRNASCVRSRWFPTARPPPTLDAVFLGSGLEIGELISGDVGGRCTASHVAPTNRHILHSVTDASMGV